MALPNSFSGSTYSDIVSAQMSALAEENGTQAIGDQLPGGGSFFAAAVSNGQAVALIQAWRRAAARGKVKWPLWVDLEAYALGQREAGQRFDMSSAHRKTGLPSEALTLLWSSLQELAADLDKSGTVVRSLPVEWTTAAYEQGARDTWEQIKGKAPKLPMPPAPPQPPKIPDEIPPPLDRLDPTAPLRSAGGWLVALAVVAVVYVVVTQD